MLIRIVALAILFLIPSVAEARKGFHLGLTAMALTNSSTQGSSGSSGSTVLTQADIFYNWLWFGFGGFVQMDRQGANETDLAFGPKLEFNYKVLFIEGAYAPFLQRSFTDRSISKQKGYAWLVGAGVRVPLGGNSSSPAGGGRGFFLQMMYKYRTQTIKTQDATALDEPIIQKDGYPLFGFGLTF